jgi:uncharacterized membrane protein
LIKAVFRELGHELFFTSWSHTIVPVAIELKVIKSVHFANICSSIFGTSLVVDFLEAERSQLSHGTVGTVEHESLFVFGNVYVGTRVV